MKNYNSTIYNEKVRPVTTYPDELARYLVERFHIRKGSKILDNGCGRGDFLKGFERCGMDVYGTDMEEVFAGVYSGIKLEKDKLPFADCYFDVVFSKSVIEHIHQPENYMNEMYRVLKPGGRIIIMVPDWHSCMYIYYDDFTHVQPYTMTGLRDALKIFGFKKVSSEIFHQLPCVWRHPQLKMLCCLLQLRGGVKKTYKNKFIRFSRELMLLGTGIKRK